MGIKLKIFFIVLFGYSCYCNSQNNLNKCSDTLYHSNETAIFLIGENHYMNGNIEIVFDIFKDLYYNHKVRVFVLERGFSEAYLVNRFVNFGDTSIFNLFVDSYFKKLYYLLYDFNKNKDEDNKIKVVGIDEESYEPYTYLSVFKILKEQSSHSPEFKLIFDNYKKNFTFNAIEKMNSDIESIYKLINADSDKYRNTMGDTAFYIYKKIYDSHLFKYSGDLNNLKNKKLDSIRIMRENFMYNNLIEHANIYGNLKYFGYFGNLHIPLNKTLWLNQKNWESLAYKLNSNIVFKNKVVSYNMIYKYSPIIFSKFNKSKSYYNFNKAYLSENSLKKIKNNYQNSKCDYIILNTLNYSDLKNTDFVILNNFKQ